MSGSSALPRRALIAFVLAGLLTVTGAACSGEGDSDAIVAEPHLEDPGAAGDPGLGSDRSRIRGTVSGGTVVGTLDGPAEGPLTLQVPSAGGGNGAVITGVTVDGVAKDIVWDGGRSLSLDGPALTLPTGRWAVGSSLSLDLERGAISLPEGTYQLVGPVAIGDSSGLAEPRDQVTFTAESSATLTGTGSSSLSIPDGALLLGPGDVSLQGSFTVTTSDREAAASTVEAEGRSFELTFTPGAEGMAVTGVLEGATTR